MLFRADPRLIVVAFYVDDVGKHVAMLAYGYSLLGEPKPVEKPDEWVGLLYACVNCVVQIETLKHELSRLHETSDPEKKTPELTKELDDWTSVAGELESVRDVTELSLQGMRETLAQLGVTFDEWDWESDLVWSGEVQDSMKKLSSSPYAITDGASLSLGVNKIATTYGLDKALGP
jgi:arginyl-tRNA synthetase